MMTSPDTEFIRILGAATDTEEAPLPKISTQVLPEALPILGLSDIVIFPAMVAPLLVGYSSTWRRLARRYTAAKTNETTIRMLLRAAPSPKENSTKERW